MDGDKQMETGRGSLRTGVHPAMEHGAVRHGEPLCVWRLRSAGGSDPTLRRIYHRGVCDAGGRRPERWIQLCHPAPGKKYKRWKGVRVKPADYFAFRYGMVAWGEYVDRQRGETYRTEPDQYRSKGFYQPEYVRYFLLKELERKQEKK